MLSLLPSMEVVELVVHWAEHGDLAHGDDDGHERSALGMDEHGCTATFHLCGCHTASVIAPAGGAELQGRELVDRDESFCSVERAGLGAMAPPIRPPIA